MAHIVHANYVVGLHWDPLFGIERESREIKSLIKVREATHYVVVSGLMGAKTIGLAQIADGVESSGSSDSSGLHAMILLVSSKLDSTDFIFVHEHPDEDDMMIVLGVREGRPSLDTVIACDQVEAVLDDFLKEKVLNAVTLIGSWPDAPNGIILDQTLSLTELFSDSSGSAHDAAALITVKKGGTRAAKILLTVLVVLGALIGAGMYAYNWYEESQKVEEDPIEVYASSVRRTFNAETSRGGGVYAEAVQKFVNELVVNALGWHLQSVTCEGMQCRLLRVRDIGADITPVVFSSATIDMKPIPEAKEVARLTLAGPPRDVKLVTLKDFYEVSLSRLMQLSDYGLTPKVELPGFLVALPSSVPRGDLDPHLLVKKGKWSLTGDLAFMDSMTSVVKKAENMVINTVIIDMKTNAPTFTATGSYYVR